MPTQDQSQGVQPEVQQSPNSVGTGKSRADVHNYFNRHNVAQVLQDALFNCVEENIQNPFEYLYDYIGSKFLHKEQQQLAHERIEHEKDDQIKELQEKLKTLEDAQKEQDIKHDQELKGLQESKVSIQEQLEVDLNKLQEQVKVLQISLDNATVDKENAVKEVKEALEVTLKEAVAQADLYKEQHRIAEHQISQLQSEVEAYRNEDRIVDVADVPQEQTQIQQQVLIEPTEKQIENVAEETTQETQGEDKEEEKEEEGDKGATTGNTGKKKKKKGKKN